MDRIEFRFTKVEYAADGYKTDAVNIFVNGKNFLDTVKKFDGDYVQIIPEYLYPDLIDGYKDNFIFIYDCGCGCSGCYPFCVFIDVGEKVVTWYDFMTAKEYFDDLCKENNFAMLKERLKKKGGLPPLVFDKKQYFVAVGVLRDWIFSKNFSIDYADIDCGYLTLNFRNAQNSESFIFDELLSDPMPQFVKLFNYIQKCIDFDKKCNDRGKSIGYSCEIELGDTYDDRITALKISAVHYDLRNILTVEIPNKNFSFRQEYLCVEWLELFKKLFAALLNDKTFPYAYPCFWDIGEDAGDDIYTAVTDELEKIHPDWSNGEIVKYAVETGKLPLSQRNKIFIEKYRKMLTDYTIPENEL
ncbi:MAG: hypothetical protein IJT73_11515 [Selenomonadaceae bacterium]|nr:hypothetical protein [Selenomonadaceae bacterium]